MARNIIGLILGIFAAGVVVWAVTSINMQLYPMPADIDIKDHEAMKEFTATLPTTAFIIVNIGDALGALVGALVGCQIASSHHRKIALGIGAFLLIMGIANLLQFPHPIWFMIIDVLVYIPFALLGYQLFKKLNPSHETL